MLFFVERSTYLYFLRLNQIGILFPFNFNSDIDIAVFDFGHTVYDFLNSHSNLHTVFQFLDSRSDLHIFDFRHTVFHFLDSNSDFFLDSNIVIVIFFLDSHSDCDSGKWFAYFRLPL